MLRTTEPKGGGERAFKIPQHPKEGDALNDEIIVENVWNRDGLVALQITNNTTIIVDAAALTAAVRECTRK